MTFYNITKRQERILRNPEPIQNGLWLLSGFAGEWTGDRSPEQGFAKVKSFKGMHIDGKVTTESRKEDFDYLLFEVLYNESYEGPESYGGFSGGGLWQLLVSRDDGRFQVTDRLLSGVAFYQSEKKIDSEGRVTRDIKCHGRRSLYRALVEKIRIGR